MRKSVTATVLALMVLAAVGSASAELVTIGSALDATLLNYDPVPAQPGDLVDIWIQVTNSGGSASKAGTITIIESYPFTLENAAEGVKKFPSIPGQSSFLVKATVRVDKNANEGENNLKVRIQEQGSNDWIEHDLAITIRGRSGALSIVSANTEPERIMPGGKGTITLRVKNIGETRLRNIDVTLDLTSLSLAPTTSSNSKTIGALAGGQEAVFSFDIITYPDATPKAYQMPVTITYEDERGNRVSQEEKIGLVIGAEPELLVYFERIGLSKESKRGDVVIKFVNKGLSEVKFLELDVLENEDVSVISESSRVYVGNIDADDYESAEMTIKVTKDEVNLPLKIRYRDALNQEHEEALILPIKLQSSNGNGSPSWGLLIFAVIIVAIIVWIVVKRRHAKRR